MRRASLFAVAAEPAKLEVVVALSQWLADPLHPATHAREKWLSIHVLSGMRGVGLVTIDPGWFADNYFAALETITHFGIMTLPLGEGRNAPPSNEDIADVIVGALIDPDRHVGRRSGPPAQSPLRSRPRARTPPHSECH